MSRWPGSHLERCQLRRPGSPPAAEVVPQRRSRILLSVDNDHHHKMLPILRPAFTRAFTVSSVQRASSSQDLMNEVMGSMRHMLARESGKKDEIHDPILPPSEPAPSSSTSASSELLPPPMPTASTSTQTIMQIPPAEDPLLRYVSSRIMKHGKRQQSNNIVARTLLHIHAFTRAPPLPIFREAVLAAAPALRIMSHRQSTKTIHKPIAISERKRTWYAVEWLLQAAEAQPGQRLEERLARAMIDILKDGSNSVALKKKKEVHTLAMVNRGNVPRRTGL